MLIGRSEDLELCLACIAGSRPLAIVADAGLGKTALLQEAGARCGRPTLTGRAPSSLKWISYLSLETALGTKLPGGDHPSIATVTGRRVGDGLLILDDVQWADDDTIRVIPYLASRIRMLVAVRADDPDAQRVRTALLDAGFAIHELQPLSDEDSETMLRTRRPDLSLLAMKAILRSAGGNPLLLEELSQGGQPSKTLQRSVLARLERMTPSARRTLATLALLGRPAGLELAGPGVRELVKAGIVIESSEGFGPRHALLGEVAVERITEEERRDIHATIAHATSDLGEAASHHELAGHHEEARACALEAAGSATRVGQRGRLLLIAARAGAEHPQHDELCLRAADALVQAGDYDNAYLIASEVGSVDPEVAAEALLYRAQALRSVQGVALSHELVHRGIDLVVGSGSTTEIRLLLEDVAVSAWTWDPAHAVPTARRALDLASGTDQETAATMALGMSLIEQGSLEGFDHLERALSGARHTGEVLVECQAAFYLVSAMKFFKRWRESLPIAADMRLRTIAAGFRSWEVMFVWHELVTLLDCAGNLERGTRLGLELIGDLAVPARLRQDIAGVVAMALLDRARFDDAWSLLDDSAPRGRQESPFPPLVRAELYLANGDPGSAIRTVDEAVANFPTDPNMLIAWVTRGWACLELGRPLEPYVGAVHPAGRCYEIELDAIGALHRGAFTEAGLAFDRAGEAARDFDIRTELRCLWQGGEMAARAGDAQRAHERFLELETRTRELGMDRLLSNVRGSLRGIGIRRSAPRTRSTGILSAREREVLGFVAKGLRTREISARLGIAPSTVESIVRSARTKLDARTRLEAAQRYVEAAATDI